MAIIRSLVAANGLRLTPLAAALKYAGADYPVLLVWSVNGKACACPKGAACKTPGKHPIESTWQRRATTERSRVLAMFRKHPDAHVGIMPPAGHVIVDIDPRNGGKETISRLLGKNFEAVTPTQISGGGGHHYVFKGAPIRSPGPGVDVKNPGSGFVVAWPSGHASGGEYKWSRGLAPWEVSPALLPHSLRSKRAKTQASPNAAQYSFNEVETALEYVPSDEYDRWIRFGQALRHDFPVDGQQAWIAWSRKSSKWQPGDESKWESFDQNNTAEPVTCASILSDARRNFGYRPRPTDFDVAPDPDRSLVVVEADKEKLVNVDWLWPDHIPRGMLTLAAGEAGEGKSSVMAAIASIVTRGGEWPDGTHMNRPGRCIWLCVEDPVNSVLLPRAVAAGIDRKRLTVITGVRNKDGDEMVFSLQDDLALLKAELQRQPDADFVVIDPVTAYLHGKRRVDLNNATDLRAILSPLAKLAEQQQVAIVCVTHLNKDEGRSFIHRVLGSQVWTAAARIVWAFGRLPDSANHEAVMIEAKRNVGKRTDAIKYRIETATVKEDNNKIDTSKIVWLGEDGSIDLLEVFGGQRGPRAGAKQACTAWLRARLAAGPMKAHALNIEAARMSSQFGERIYAGERAKLCEYNIHGKTYRLKGREDVPGDFATGEDSVDDLL